MNKQQLAAKIWESANQMRSKIEANEYKDYILGFIFYKYLSDQEVQFAIKSGCTDEEITLLAEEDTDTMEHFRDQLGYFIAYEHLFSTWIKMGQDFDVANVRDALSAFSRLINPIHKKLFTGIFDTLQTGLSKLGDSSASQTKAISQLIHLIKDIPMDGRQDYDVLGFIYEYLIGMFAANAGKKAGEFYTPHEVSLLMSEIIADHLKDREKIEIYDSTSGSGSLLINIGQSVAKHIHDDNKIKYYAQELKQNTYNLTRMNLIMRGILVDNIITRNGDTLEEDWPFFEETDPVGTYDPLHVDAVVSNPPYSQKWDTGNKKSDPRFARFGTAPKSKADYAFLLHDLYHLKNDGIMSIVLPHGVLFRGGEEGMIRQNLIEENHIDAIIGLPANIFFGTGIPTIIMVLRQKRENTDVLIVDASKGFEKVGKNNKLRAADIKRIVDTVTRRQSNEKFSRVVSRDEIRQNGYNLNIPRYVDASEEAESWDLYASMFGGIPETEIDGLSPYWQALPGLRSDLFVKTSDHYTQVKVADIKQAIREHAAVQAFVKCFASAFGDFDDFLKRELIAGMNNVKIAQEEEILSRDIFARLATIPLIDPYQAYQLLDDGWNKIAIDLEMIQTEGFAATKKIDPYKVVKKKDGKEQEVQEGWLGHILPFELVQATCLSAEYQKLKQLEDRLQEISAGLEEIIDTLADDEKETSILNDTNDAFVAKEVTKTVKEIYADVETTEITVLNGYLALLGNKAKKTEKETYINTHPQTAWTRMAANKDGTYASKVVKDYLAELQTAFSFPEDSFESKMVSVDALLTEEKELKKQQKTDAATLHLLTKKTIEDLSDDQVLTLLEEKWLTPLMTGLSKLPEAVIGELATKVAAQAEKYATTFMDIEEQINEAENTLVTLIDELTGSDDDLLGLAEFQRLLKGE